MLLEAADKTTICQQVMLISSEIFTYGFLFGTNLVDLHWVPNDLHMVQKWS